MTLNPAVQSLLAMMEQAPKIDFDNHSAPEARAIFDNPMNFGEPIAMAKVENLAIDLPGRTLEARFYLPEGAGEAAGLTVYFHGGGWVIGTLDTHDGTCRAIAQKSGAAVLSIAYRLAPEHRYPAAAEDCFEATMWAAANTARLGIDGSKIAVAGDSAGGNLAAAVAIMARDAGGPAFAHQLLIYPVTDVDFDRASYVANGAGEYFLSTVGMQWFWNHYLGDTPADQAPLAVVLNQADLSGLAPATVITAEYDPLRDEGDAYAEKLKAAGVDVDWACAPGMIHGFFGLYQVVPDAWEWVDRGAANLRKAFAEAD
jgi:acetyl esterase